MQVLRRRRARAPAAEGRRPVPRVTSASTGPTTTARPAAIATRPYPDRQADVALSRRRGCSPSGWRPAAGHAVVVGRHHVRHPSQRVLALDAGTGRRSGSSAAPFQGRRPPAGNRGVGISGDRLHGHDDAHLVASTGSPATALGQRPSTTGARTTRRRRRPSGRQYRGRRRVRRRARRERLRRRARSGS